MVLLRLAAPTLIAAALAVGQPRIAIEGGKAFDFGELLTTSPVTRELRIMNGGTDTLRITNVSGSCGCTGTLLSENNIPPGGNGTLKITFDPAKFSGKVDKVVSMHTNDPADPDPHITFTATITKILDFDQSHLVFATVVDSEVVDTVSVRNVSDSPLRITGARSSQAELTVTLTTDRLGAGDATSMICRVTPRRAGILKGDITITTDNPRLPSIDLRFFGYAKPASSPPGATGR
jgi:hypothetical protein